MTFHMSQVLSPSLPGCAAVTQLSCYSLSRKKEKKRLLLSMITEKLMVKLSFLLA